VQRLERWMTVPQGVIPEQQMPGPVVEATGIHKRFGSTYALRGVDLSLSPGRCLGLVGRNGAGKSTLVSILAGVLAPDAGQVRLGGPIATVFQHSMVVPSLTVAENVFLGSPPGRGGLVSWRAMRAQTRKVMSEWGFDVNADAPCASLTVEQRQIVEIARALAAGSRCLLLDEPTAALERGAVQRLFERIRQLRGLGVAILYISHHLEEVFEICTEAAVLRDGEMVLAAPLGGLAKDDLVAAMVGTERGVESPSVKPAARAAAGTAAGVSQAGTALTVTDVALDAPGASLRGVSLTVRKGERLGITGLRGSGATTLARVVAGAVTPDAGTVQLGSRVLRPGDRIGAMRAGVGYIPEDRQADGFVPLLGVAENITMTIVDRLARLGLVPPRAREARAAPLARSLSVVSAGLGQPTGELSGGNQQKVTVARALARDPKLIVAITPTRGVDVASKELLLAELDRIASETGASLLLASDELDDLIICDRVVVLVRGEIFTEFTDPPFNREALIAATEGLEATR
jgi:simple sugar transport system ATP-binding protein